MQLQLNMRSVIPQASDRLGDFAFDLVEHVLAGVHSRSAATAPTGETGHLGNSIAHNTERTRDGAEGEATAGAEYAAYVNYGTGSRGAASAVPGRGGEVRYSVGWQGMVAQPFMSQAAETGKDEWDRGWRNLERELPHL